MTDFTDEMQVKRLVKAIVEEMDKRRSVSAEEHRAHHAFLDAWIQKEQRKEERWNKVRTQLTGWGIITFLGGIGAGAYHLWQYVIKHLH